MAVVRITKHVIEAIVSHAMAEAPLECCGLLTGSGDVVTHHHRMRNVLASRVRYAMDPRELFRFFKELRSANQKHLGIYHSHPASEAFPSETDVQESFYPDCAYVIVSLKNTHSPEVRAFRIDNAAVQEFEIVQV
jgi:[CysO sulfur-carrier protein]-S-L-cysteine hydrolase